MAVSSYVSYKALFRVSEQVCITYGDFVIGCTSTKQWQTEPT